jgi:hypothetical protein
MEIAGNGYWHEKSREKSEKKMSFFLQKSEFEKKNDFFFTLPGPFSEEQRMLKKKIVRKCHLPLRKCRLPSDLHCKMD